MIRSRWAQPLRSARAALLAGAASTVGLHVGHGINGLGSVRKTLRGHPRGCAQALVFSLVRVRSIGACEPVQAMARRGCAAAAARSVAARRPLRDDARAEPRHASSP
jgi:hypothetical protein